MPVLVLAGDEEFELSRRVESLKKELLDSEWAAMNLSRHIAPGLPEVCEAAALLPFGDGNKLVLIERCDLFAKKRSKSSESGSSAAKNEPMLEPFERALNTVSPKTYIVFCCPLNFDSTLRTSKIV